MPLYAVSPNYRYILHITCFWRFQKCWSIARLLKNLFWQIRLSLDIFNFRDFAFLSQSINTFCCWYILNRSYRLCAAVIGHFLYVVYHTIKQPLDIYLYLTPQTKFVHPFVHANIGKYWLNNGDSLGIDFSAFFYHNLLGRVSISRSRYRDLAHNSGRPLHQPIRFWFYHSETRPGGL